MNSITTFFMNRKKQLLMILGVVILPLLVVFWWWGMFNDSQLYEKTSRGPYHFAYVEHEGDYAYIADHQMNVLRKLEKQGITAGASFIIMESDPRNTKRKKRKAKVGYLIPNEIKQLKEDLLVGDIPKRDVLVVSVKAQILLAPSKAYTTLVNYTKEKNVPLNLPTVEVYEDSTLHVEMPLQ